MISESITRVSTHLGSKSAKGRKLTLAILDTCVKNIDAHIASISKTKEEYKGIKRVRNMMQGLHTRIEDKDITLSESRTYMNSVLDEVDEVEMLVANSSTSSKYDNYEEESNRLKRTIKILEGKLENSQGNKKRMLEFQLTEAMEKLSGMKDILSDARTSKSFAHLMQGYEKVLNKKLSASPVRQGTFKTVVVPVEVEFDSYRLNADVLNSAGMKADKVTLQAGTSGKSITVINDQVLLTFSEKYAQELYAQINKQTFDSSPAVKQRKALLAKKRPINKDLTHAQANIDVLEKALEKKLAAGSKYADKTKQKLDGWIEQRDALQKDVDAIEVKIKGLHTENHRAKKRLNKKNTNEEVQLAMLTKILDLLNERSNTEYSAVTSMPRKNPKNADTLMFWIMPTRQWAMLRGAVSGASVVNWSLPSRKRRR